MGQNTLQSYELLKEKFSQIRHLKDAISILNRDMITVMPKGSASDRTHQTVSIAKVRHEKLTDPKILELISEAEEASANLSPWDQANVTAMKRMYLHATAISDDLAAEEARLSSVGNQKHSQWLKSGDWEDHKTHLEEVFSVRKEVAQAKKEKLNTETAYDALLDEYDPYSDTKSVEAMFAPVEAFLCESIPLVADKKERKELKGQYSLTGQEELYRQVIKDLGFNLNKGEFFMVQQHPSCGGTPDDVRFTTRCDESEFLDALRAVVHETGHALYEQNLPEKWRYQPVGNSLGMSIHESQSLFWEVQVSNHPSFFDYLSPIIRQAFNLSNDDQDHLPHSLLACGNTVSPGYIRIEADEMTYPMHVFLRFDLEKRLFDGSLEVKEIPEAWSDGLYKRLGLRPPNHSKGCMQDIHWSQGAFGYFPCYTLGAMIAAQLHAHIVKDLEEFDSLLKQGNFSPILEWLTNKIHSQASLYSPSELVESACGEPLNPDYFINHLKNRFLNDANSYKQAS